MQHSYQIDNEDFLVTLSDDSYEFGAAETLTTRFGDLSSGKEWYSEGFTLENSEDFYDRRQLYEATTLAVKNIISDLIPNADLRGFTLEQYHRFVPEELHLDVIARTRRLYPKDLAIDVQNIVKKFSDYFGINLSFTNPISGETHWMIARINRPKSKNFNTAHKDIYEVFDKHGAIPKMINVWIPLCGVTNCNSLPIVPRSHLLPEDRIERTQAGSVINDVKYSVASIKSWDSKSSLRRVRHGDDQFLIFSSHLIHGLAFNNREDLTRISFEFRLYEETLTR